MSSVKLMLTKNNAILEFWVKLLEIWLDIVFWSFRELYYLSFLHIVSFPFCIFVFVWSEQRPQNIVWSVLVTKKSTFRHVWSQGPEKTLCAD